METALTNPPATPRSAPAAPNAAAVEEFPADVSLVPDNLRADKGDAPSQSEILLELRRNDVDRNREDRFAKLYPSTLDLSRLRSNYERRSGTVINFLCGRNCIRVDDDLKLAMGTGRIHMDTAESTIDFHMTVANRIGLSAILPNVDSAHQFGLELDLKKEYKEFKGKHGTLGFDPTGCMLFVGRSNNEDVFLAMAPDEFIANPAARRDARKRAAGSSRMSRRHYRQVVIMLAFFMSSLERHPFIRLGQDPYEIDLESGKEKFDEFTDALYVLPIESSNHLRAVRRRR